ncbi:fatty acid desaturase [Schlegelella sp. ID0723]|uniref:Fatty acid desaturase n=2 Tax=Piscinibacter koreensis TaxID=2742824 RepID=A0A7Y6TVP8_9BURK|nr:fatty acid desaturase [Schlegelella koreensis]
MNAPVDGAELPDPAADTAPHAEWREDARRLIGELFQRSPAIYWVDFLASTSLAWAFGALYMLADGWSAWQLVGLLGASVFFFRAGTFIHEIVHMPARQMVGFKRAWNALIGIPLLMPWIMYRNHTEHHNHRLFGTPADGEYLPLASSPIGETIKYLAQAPLLPLFQLVRFGVLAPLSWLFPRFREWVLTRASAAVSNPYYRKRFPRRDERHLKMVEALCFAYLVVLGVLTWRGVIEARHLGRAYILVALTLALNWVRNLAAHRYGNDGRGMTLAQQVEDSINITGQTWLTVVLFPVGLRYHALHHMFPALPYHNLGRAHQRLMEGLPADSPYRSTNRASFFAGVRELWVSARRTSRPQSSMQRWSAPTPRT